MKLTITDVENIFSLKARAHERPIGFDEMHELLARDDPMEMMTRTEMCRLSNGWLVMFDYEFQRPDVLCAHVAVGFPNPRQGTIYAISRIMTILGLRYPARALPGWDDVAASEAYPLIMHVVEPCHMSLEEFHQQTTEREITDGVNAHFSG